FVHIAHDAVGDTADEAMMLRRGSSHAAVTIHGRVLGGVDDENGTRSTLDDGAQRSENGRFLRLAMGNDLQGRSGSGDFCAGIDGQNLLRSAVDAETIECVRQVRGRYGEKLTDDTRVGS